MIGSFDDVEMKKGDQDFSQSSFSELGVLGFAKNAQRQPTRVSLHYRATPRATGCVFVSDKEPQAFRPPPAVAGGTASAGSGLGVAGAACWRYFEFKLLLKNIIRFCFSF